MLYTWGLTPEYLSNAWDWQWHMKILAKIGPCGDPIGQKLLIK